jgi:predicted  nucleic acid-binding Zn-ribbon protein
MKDFLQALKQHITGKVTTEAEQRASICAECPLKELRDYARIFNSKMEDVNGYVCTGCSCPLATKIFAKEPENICPKWIQ